MKVVGFPSCTWLLQITNSKSPYSLAAAAGESYLVYGNCWVLFWFVCKDSNFPELSILLALKWPAVR